MKRSLNILVIALLLGAVQTVAGQTMEALVKGGTFVLKAGGSHWAMFEDIGAGDNLIYIGAEKALGEESHFSATDDAQVYAGGTGFFYMGTVGLRYYLGSVLDGLNAGVWAVYDDGALGAGAKAGYQVPLGKLFLDMGAGPAFIGGAGGGTFMGTASTGFKLGD